MKRLTATAALMILAAAPLTGAYAFPIGVAVRGGIGIGYYSMNALDDHFAVINREYELALPELTDGINVMLQGRLWLLEFAAVSAGYEHFWGESEVETGETVPITYKAPADVYTLGAVVKAFTVPVVVDVNLGGNVCFARSTFGTNLSSGRRLAEYKGSDAGFELYAEAATNFLLPVELSVQLGYRGLTIEDFEDKFGEAAHFPESTAAVQIGYSGFFFYLTAGLRL